MAATLVQQALLSSNGGAATLSSAPTVGNLLLAFVTQFGATGAAQNGYTLLNSYSGTDDTLYVLAKAAGSGESASQDPLTNPGGAGRTLAVMELSGWDSASALSSAVQVVDHVAETASASMLLRDTTMPAYASAVGFFATTGSNSLPTVGDSGSSSLTPAGTIQGTSTSASPRAGTVLFAPQSRVNFLVLISGGPYNMTAQWGGTVNGYGAMVAVAPGPQPPDLEVSVASAAVPMMMSGAAVSVQSVAVPMLSNGLAVAVQSTAVALLQSPNVTTPAAGSASASASALGRISAFNPKPIRGTASATATAVAGAVGYQSRGSGTAIASASATGAITSRSTIGRGNASAGATATGAGMAYRRAGGGIASATATASGRGLAIRNVVAGVASATAKAVGGASFVARIGAGTASAGASASGVMTAALASGGTLYGASVKDTMTLQASTSQKLGVRAAILEALAFQGSASSHVVFTIRDTMRLSLTQLVTGRMQVTTGASFKLRDSLLRTLRLQLIDTARFTLTHQEKMVLRLLDRIGLLSTLSAKATYLRTVRDAVVFRDTLLRGLGLSVTDHITAGDSDLVKLMVLIGLQEQISLHDAASPVWMLGVRVDDNVDLTQELIAKMVFHPELFSGIELVGGMLDANGDLSVWAMNTRTAAVTEYDNYPFNSFARLGPQQYVGASDDGLYELTGDDDDGNDIIAVIRSGYLQFGGTHLSRLKEAYIALRGTGQIVLKIITADGMQYVYQTPTLNMVNNKVHMAKGQRARYFQFELVTAGQDFTLDTIEFVPVVVKRRI